MPQETVQPSAVTEAPVVTDPAAVGQGDDLTSGLFSLDTVPEAIREQMAPFVKEWDGNVTREFQKRAEATKAWEPYDELGLRDIAPEDVGHLISFYDIASDEAKFKTWVQETYGKLGLGEATDPAAAAAAGAEEGQQQFLTQEQFEEKLQAREQEREQQQQQEELHEQVAQEVRTTLDELVGKLGITDVKDKEEVEDLLCFMAQRHQDGSKSVSEALTAGFADYQRRMGKVESDALDAKLQQPRPAVTAGGPHSPPEKSATLSEAGDRLRERLRAANAQ